jgi:hypothetical protein
MGKLIGVLSAGVVLVFGLAAWGTDATPAAKSARDSSSASTANRYVRQALAAELAGDDARRNELLKQALAADPNCRAARWQLGYVSLDGKWLSPQEADRKYSSDRNLAEYRKRRDQAAAAGLFTRGPVSNTAGGTAGGPIASRGASVDSYRTGALSPEGVAANVELARWCRTKRLTDEERAHWTQVLFEDPTNGEAQSRLGMHWYKGNLLNTAQIEAIKKQQAAEEKQLSEWKATVARWRKMLDNGSPSEADAAIVEMQAIADPAVIPALEQAVASDSAKPTAGAKAASPFQREAMALLGRLPDQRATFALVQHSLLSKVADVRTAATKELKRRPLHDFVPVLLAGLANPIQFDYSMAFDPSLGLAIYRAVGLQEGRDTVTRVEYSTSAAGLLPSFVGAFDSGVDRSTRIDVRKTPVIAATSPYDSGKQTIVPGPRNIAEVPGAAAIARQSQQVAMSVAGQNERIAVMNERINFVMEQVTGKKSGSAVEPKSAKPAADGSDPASAADEAAVIPEATAVKPQPSVANSWWNWWADYTDTYLPEKNVSSTTYGNGSYASRSQYLSVYGGNSSSRPSSTGSFECFAAGTPVVTLTGPVAIEKLQIGDRVLAQNPDTGELAYKFVMGLTIRPPAETVLVSTTHGEIRASRGHPFWIVGKGWRMAKELEVGDRLHCLEGSARVTAIVGQPNERVYNLTVADYGTYFVGEGQVLVHDNTPRLPTRAALPGFVVARD